MNSAPLKRLSLLAAGLTCALSFVAVVAPPRAWAQTGAPRLLLPDLRSLPPSDLRLDTRTLPGRRLLRLTNTVWNEGNGPLELRGAVNGSRDRVQVTQRVLARTGAPEDRPVGRFVYHPAHRHTHFEDFSQYEVWTIAGENGLGRRLAASDKVGWCLWDDDRVATRLPGAPSVRVYSFERCGTEVQGLSVGWGDTYAARLDGQTVDVTGLRDGHYALRTVADPRGVIRELDETNNDAVVHFTLSGARVEVESKK